jgi:uncharacterized RDD family membrane protein YckC
MHTIQVRTAQNVFIHYPVASVSDRILGYLLDLLILTLYFIALIALIIQIKLEEGWVMILLFAVPYLFYSIVFEIFMNGQTPGKRAMNVQVVRVDGSPPTVGNYIVRWLFALLEFQLFSGVIAILTILITGKGQRLGDVVAGTSVIKLIPQEEITSRSVFVMGEEAYQPTFSQVIVLQEQDVELIQQALEVNKTHDNPRPMLIAAERVKNLLGITTDMPPVKFLYTIIKDYNHYASR